MPALRRRRLPSCNPRRPDSSRGSRRLTALHHPQRLPLVLAGRRCRLPPLPRNHHRQLRPLAYGAGRFRFARHAGRLVFGISIRSVSIRPEVVIPTASPPLSFRVVIPTDPTVVIPTEGRNLLFLPPRFQFKIPKISRLSVAPPLVPTYTFPFAMVGTENRMPLPRVSRATFCWLLYNSTETLEAL